MQNNYIIIFKDITEGFMDLAKINFIADILKKHKDLKNHLSFFLENNLKEESNQAIMQMYNRLLGYDIFKGSYSNHHFLEYNYRNEFQLRKKLELQSIDLETYLKNKYQNTKIKTYYVTKDIYKELMSILKECI